MFLGTTKLQRSRDERITDHITSFEEGTKTPQDTAMNLLNIVDIPGWMLVRGAGLDLERRERLITALLDGHLSMIEVSFPTCICTSIVISMGT